MMLPRAMKIFAALLFLLGAGLLAGTFFYQSRFAQTVQMMKPYDKATRELRDGEIGSEVGSPARVFVTDKSKLLNNGEPNAQGHPLWDYSQGAPMFVSTAWGLMGLLTGIFWLIGGLSWVVASRAAQRRTVPPRGGARGNPAFARRQQPAQRACWENRAPH
jgi:hypothetical protein